MVTQGTGRHCMGLVGELLRAKEVCGWCHCGIPRIGITPSACGLCDTWFCSVVCMRRHQGRDHQQGEGQPAAATPVLDFECDICRNDGYRVDSGGRCVHCLNVLCFDCMSTCDHCGRAGCADHVPHPRCALPPRPPYHPPPLPTHQRVVDGII